MCGVIRLTLVTSFLALLGSTDTTSTLPLDPNGYVLYCPCMGRFGNQAEHFLGALSYAKGLDRTLVLPPWVEYVSGNPRSVQVPFDKYFKVEPLLEYHRVMTMEVFMKELAPDIWPPGKRTVYCYANRPSIDGSTQAVKTCNAKEGNPFGPFWDTFNIDFDVSEFYGPLSYRMDDPNTVKMWNQKYSPDKHYVLAFTGAPAAFPVAEKDVPLHQYLQWSDYINGLADEFLEKNGIKRPFLGVHLRHGSDWKNACSHVSPSKDRNMFGSAQCLGYRLEHGHITDEMCYPSIDTYKNQIKDKVKQIKAKAVFVAYDSQPLISEIQSAVGKKVKVVSLTEREPHVDLALLAKADHYIGNCVSTFSHFATRERKSNGKSSGFWAFQWPKHDEL